MSTDQISPNSVAANPADLNPQVKAAHVAAIPQVNQDAQKTVEAIKTDTVTISQEAVQKLANDSDVAAQELKEKTAEQAEEARKRRG